MGINDPSACVCVWIKSAEYITIEQLYIEPLVYKNKRVEMNVYLQQAQVVHN